LANFLAGYVLLPYIFVCAIGTFFALALSSYDVIKLRYDNPITPFSY